jgi:RNA polymerase sigma factor (sigma-70 family)
LARRPEAWQAEGARFRRCDRTEAAERAPIEVPAAVVQMSLSAPIRKDASAAGVPPVRAPRSVWGSRSEERLEERVFALVYRQMNALWGRWRGDFDDLVQAAAEQALRSLPAFRKESELSTWTYKICYHTVLRHRRWSMRWLRRFSLDAPHADAPDRSTDACVTLEQAERVARMRAALDCLSHKLRAVVVLRDLEGLEIDEITEIVGSNKATVRSRLRDGRKRLSELLRSDPYFGAEDCEEVRR